MLPEHPSPNFPHPKNKLSERKKVENELEERSAAREAELERT